MRKQPPLNFNQDDPRDAEVDDLREKLKVAEQALMEVQQSEVETVTDDGVPVLSFRMRPGLFLITLAWIATARAFVFCVVEKFGTSEPILGLCANVLCGLAAAWLLKEWVSAEWHLHRWLVVGRGMWVLMGLSVGVATFEVPHPDPVGVVAAWLIVVITLWLGASSLSAYAPLCLQRFLDHPIKTVKKGKKKDDKTATGNS